MAGGVARRTLYRPLISSVFSVVPKQLPGLDAEAFCYAADIID